MTPCDTRSVIRTSRANIRLVDPETKGLTKTTPSGLPLSPGLLPMSPVPPPIPGFLRNPEGCRPDRCLTFEGVPGLTPRSASHTAGSVLSRPSGPSILKRSLPVVA